MTPILELFDLLKRKDKIRGPVTYIIAGLGNPGSKYENTRHNAGFMAIDLICKFNEAKLDRMKFKGIMGEAEIENERCVLLKPMTYMNESGVSVEQVKSYYKINISKVIVLTDDISLPVGKIRIREKGGAGGHNGLKSIIENTGDDNFIRIKIGVGSKPTADYDLAKWVLSKFGSVDKDKFEECLDDVNEAVNLIVSGDIQKAMNKFN